MKDFIGRVKRFSKHLTDDIETLVKNHNTEKVHIQELLPLIIGHEETKISTQDLLGNVYNTYQLDLFPYYLHLETKGKDNTFILQMTLSSQDKEIFSFKSYDETTRSHKLIPVPQPLLESLKLHQEKKILH
ncbi:hypothetical protein ACOJQI_09085 [Bacillus salacetis]|uniref:hypothetical protein n=1 Tax=Bacillus salacetis TaxID=2315464 RepID=UPI003BA1A227